MEDLEALTVIVGVIAEAETALSFCVIMVTITPNYLIQPSIQIRTSQ